MSGERPNAGFDGFQKRSGLIVPFSWQKIELAIDRAVEEIARKQLLPKNEGLASKVTDQVLQQLANPTSEFYVHADESGKRIPKIEDVQDLVEIVLAEQGETLVVAAYKRYRKQRQIARRNIRVRGQAADHLDVTDSSLLLVESSSQSVNLPWDRKRIVKQIIDKTDLSVELAINVAKSVENRIIGGDLTTVSTTLIRELVNNELAERGYSQQLRDLSLYRVSKDDLESLMSANPAEAANTPEMVNQGIAELVLKQWALDNMFSTDVKRAHDTGAFHIHNLGRPTQLQDASVSVEYVKKFGLKEAARPAGSATMLTNHLNRFLQTLQGQHSGTISLPHLNIFYAPFLCEHAEEELAQIARELVFSLSGNVRAIDLHPGIPPHLQPVPAIGPGGKYRLRLKDGSTVSLSEELRAETDAEGYAVMDLYYEDPELGKRLVLRELSDAAKGELYDPDVQAMLEENGEAIVTYADYSAEAQAFCCALLQAAAENKSSACPKCSFHISDETLENAEEQTLLKTAVSIAAQKDGFDVVFDRDADLLSDCGTLRGAVSPRMLRHPESLRACTAQNITINIPQAAYRAARIGGDIIALLLKELDHTLELAVDAHLQKKAKAAEMMSGPGHPLGQVGKTARDGKPWVDLETCTYGLSPAGLNNAVHFLIGQELHQSPETQQLGLKIVAHLHQKAKKLSAKHNLRFALLEPAAESAGNRFAKSDRIYFSEESLDIVQGLEGAESYTASTHLSSEANLSWADRINEEAKYHTMLDNAVIPCPAGQEQPQADALEQMLIDVFHRTQASQISLTSEWMPESAKARITVVSRETR